MTIHNKKHTYIYVQKIQHEWQQQLLGFHKSSSNRSSLVPPFPPVGVVQGGIQKVR